MTSKLPFNLLGRKPLVAVTLVALSVVIAPVANAQLQPPPRSVPCGVFDLGGGCGGPTPVLTATIRAVTITPMLYGAAPNSMVVIAADVGPFAAPQHLATPCVLHVDQSMLSAIGTFQTDAAGSWMMVFAIPAFPFPIRAHLQAAVASPNAGPLGNASLTNGLDIWRPCPPCTFSRADWAAATGQAAVDFDAYWITLFPAGMDVGVFNPANGAMPPNGNHWTPDATGRSALKSTLATITGISSPLTSDFTNPTSTTSGPLGRLTAVLRLNIRFSEAGFLGSTVPGMGNLIYSNPGVGDGLEGMTVNQILLAADQALAGNGLPPGYSFNSLGGLLEHLSISFANCIPSSWASVHLLHP